MNRFQVCQPLQDEGELTNKVDGGAWLIHGIDKFCFGIPALCFVGWGSWVLVGTVTEFGHLGVNSFFAISSSQKSKIPKHGILHSRMFTLC
jgi:hypothetical protein